jgi:hypothetical protein
MREQPTGGLLGSTGLWAQPAGRESTRRTIQPPAAVGQWPLRWEKCPWVEVEVSLFRFLLNQRAQLFEPVSKSFSRSTIIFVIALNHSARFVGKVR